MTTPLVKVGVTEDGQDVVAGVFALYDTYGLPFEEAFTALRTRRIIPSWRHLRDDAYAAGWTEARVRARLHESVGDVYGPAFRAVVFARLGWPA